MEWLLLIWCRIVHRKHLKRYIDIHGFSDGSVYTQCRRCGR